MSKKPTSRLTGTTGLPALLAATAPLILACSPAAAQALESRARVGIGMHNDGSGRRMFTSDPGTYSASISHTEIVEDCLFSASASCEADYGYLYVTTAGSNPANDFGHAEGDVKWSDPAMAIGSNGSGYVRAKLVCQASQSGNGVADISLRFCEQEIARGTDAAVSGTRFVNIPVSFGMPFTLSAQICKGSLLSTDAMYEFDHATCASPDGGMLTCVFYVEALEVYKVTASGDVLLPHAIVRGQSGTTYLGPELANPVHVAEGAPLGGSGLDWAQPVALAWALDLARLPATPVTDIWVRAGTYKPDDDYSTPGNRFTYFDIPSVTLVGHFAGDESSPDDRDLDNPLHASVLSGDLAGDDATPWDTSHRSDNSRQIARCVGALNQSRNVVLDGLIFQGGEANDTNTTNFGTGGGVHVNYWVSIAIRNCSFAGCRANFGGGGLWAQIADVTLDRCTFERNTSMTEYPSASSGGALNVSWYSTLLARDCVFLANSGIRCGAVDAGSTTNTFERCVFESNSGSVTGAIRHHAGQFNVTDSRFTSNVAVGYPMDGYGGAVSGAGSLTGCIFERNTASHDGGAAIGNLHVQDCEFRGNSGRSGGALFNPLMIVRSTFVGNHATEGGGAITSKVNYLPVIASRFIGNSVAYTSANAAGAVYLTGNGTIDQCEFFSNRAQGSASAGAIYSMFYGTTPTITNSTFAGNSADSAGAVFANRSLCASGEVRLYNSIIWANSGPQLNTYCNGLNVQYSIVQGGYSGEQNLAEDPEFIDGAGSPGDDNEWLTDDDDAFNLGLSRCSPAIDRASNALLASDVADLDQNGVTAEKVPLDLAGNPRTTGPGDAPIADRGAYEAPCPADFDGTGFVDLDDYIAFVHTFESGTGDADLDCTGFVDLDDFIAFVSAFEAGC